MAARFCAHLSGELVKPFTYTFHSQDNVCIFVKAGPNAPVPMLTESEFVCAP